MPEHLTPEERYVIIDDDAMAPAVQRLVDATREESRVKPDADLDRELALALGWYQGEYGVWHSPRRNGVMSHGDCPRYSSDWAAMGELISEMDARQFWFEAHRDHLSGYSARFVGILWYSDKTMPLAIARAARAALKGERT